MTESKCYQCGKPATNEHHTIPKSLKPLKNKIIPLCDEHKDICHPIIKQFYFPNKLRSKLGKIKGKLNDLQGVVDAFQRELQPNRNKKIQTQIAVLQITANSKK